MLLWLSNLRRLLLYMFHWEVLLNSILKTAMTNSIWVIKWLTFNSFRIWKPCNWITWFNIVYLIPHIFQFFVSNHRHWQSVSFQLKSFYLGLTCCITTPKSWKKFILARGVMGVQARWGVGGLTTHHSTLSLPPFRQRHILGGGVDRALGLRGGGGRAYNASQHTHSNRALFLPPFRQRRILGGAVYSALVFKTDSRRFETRAMILVSFIRIKIA